MSSKTALLKHTFNEIVRDTLDSLPFLRERSLEQHLRLSLNNYLSDHNGNIKPAEKAFSNDVTDWLDMAHRFETTVKPTAKTPNIDWQSVYKIIIGINYLEMGGFDDLYGAMERPMLKDPDFFADHFSIRELNIFSGYMNLLDEEARPQEDKLELWGNPIIPIESRILFLSQSTLEMEELIAQYSNHTFLPEDIAGKFSHYIITFEEFYQADTFPQFREYFDLQNQIFLIFDNQPAANSTVKPLFATSLTRP